MSQQSHDALDESLVQPNFSDDDFTGDQADLAAMSQQPQSALDESFVLPTFSDDDFADDQADLAAMSQEPPSAIDESSVQPTLSGNHGNGAVRIKDATPRTTFRLKPYHIVGFPTRKQRNTINPFFSDDDFAGDRAELATMSQQPPSALDESLVLPTFNDEDLAGDQAGLAAPQPPWWRGRRGIIIIAVILLFIILGGIVLAIRLTRRPTRVYQTATITQGNFSLTISATGPLQGGIYNINFTGGGIISELDVKVGQTVKQGQVLAKLDKTSLQDAVNTAQATVMQDETAINNSSSTSGATQAQSSSSIASDQKAVTSAQNNLTQVQAQATANVSAAQTDLSNAQTNLSKVQAQSSANVSVARTTLSNDQTHLSKVQAESAASVDAARTTLENDQAKLTQAQAQLATANANFAAACPNGATPNIPTVACSNKVINAMTTAKTNEATAQATVDADQSALKTAQATASANNAAAQATVDADRQALNKAEADASASNATARATVDTNQKALTTAEANASASTATMQGDVTTAQNALNNAVTAAGLSNTNAQGTVNTAQSTLQKDLTALQTAQHNLQNDTLKAPHAGVVTTINGTVGGSPGVASASSVATTGSTFIQIVDLAALQVVANVNESDTANLKVGDPAQFTVSAYGERVFNGTVSAISPNGVTVSNVVTYPVTIDVATNDLRGANLLPGMTANVTLIVVQRSNVLLIPVSAVSFARLASTPSTTSGTPQLISSAQASVALDQARSTLRQLEIQNPNIGMDNPTAAFVLERSGQTFVAKPVVLGLTDGVVYEVLSGLTAGETIITGVQTQPGG